MDSKEDALLFVNLVRSDAGNGDTMSKKNLESISKIFPESAFLYVPDRTTCVLFRKVNFSPRFTKCKNFTSLRTNTLYFNRGDGKIGVVNNQKLLGHIIASYNLSGHKSRTGRNDVTCVTYDLSTDKFVSEGARLPARRSKKVEPHQVVSLKQGHAVKTQQDGERLVGETMPLLTHGAGTQETRFPVQATDGPHENVELDSPFTTVFQSAIANIPLPATPAIPRSGCRHPDYAEEYRRVLTFARGWPHPPDVQNTDRLAKYGMYYTGQADLVRCYHCGLGMKDWSSVDDPLMEHLKYSPACPHLLAVVDPSLLQSYRVRLNRRNTEAGQYRHPEYATEESRRVTFDSWPRDLTQTPDVLVKAGFFYTGFEDRVRCYCCDGGLQHWDTPDDPWVEHVRWFPHCAHVRRVRGDDYVRMVQLALQHDDSEEEDATPSDVTEAAASGSSGGPRESDDIIYHPAAQNVMITCGFSAAAVRMAIQECDQKGVRWNSEVLANLLYEKQERGETLPTDPERSETPVQSPVDDTSAEGLQRERSRLLGRLKCLQCRTSDANILFLPCAHRKVCRDCARGMDTCPVCHTHVREKVLTYMA